MEALGPVRLTEVRSSKADNKRCAKLSDDGTIVLAGRGGEEMVNDEDLLDKSGDELDKRSDQADFIKIEELLEFANSKVFDSEEDLLEKKKF